MKVERSRMLVASRVSTGRGSDREEVERGVPRMFSSTHTPRTTGEVSTPLAVAVMSRGLGEYTAPVWGRPV